MHECGVRCCWWLRLASEKYHASSCVSTGAQCCAQPEALATVSVPPVLSELIVEPWFDLIRDRAGRSKVQVLAVILPDPRQEVREARLLHGRNLYSPKLCPLGAE